MSPAVDFFTIAHIKIQRIDYEVNPPLYVFHISFCAVLLYCYSTTVVSRFLRSKAWIVCPLFRFGSSIYTAPPKSSALFDIMVFQGCITSREVGQGQTPRMSSFSKGLGTSCRRKLGQRWWRLEGALGYKCVLLLGQKSLSSCLILGM